MARQRVSISLVALAALAGPIGCDRLTAVDYAGAKVQLTLTGARPTSAGRHLELWARDGNDLILRLMAGNAGDSCQAGAACIDAHQYSPSLSAYAVMPAVDLADPCMIDAGGNLLWQTSGQPGPSDGDRDLQSKAVLQRIQQLTGGAATPLLALVSWDDSATTMRPVRAADAGACGKLAPKPCIPDDASGLDRLTACRTFWSASPFAYSGNPLQLTSPVHGQLFGMLDYSTLTPSQIYGGIQILSEWSLRDLKELWFTETTAPAQTLDPDEIASCATRRDTCRGELVLDGMAGAAQHGIYRFDLGSPRAGVSGTASVTTRLDDDPVQF